MTITRSDCRYYIKEIKDLAKNFDFKELKLMYDLLMEDVYGDNGIKGY